MFIDFTLQLGYIEVALVAAAVVLVAYLYNR